MLCLQRLANQCLLGITALSCLGIGASYIEAPSHVSDSSSTDDASHRGSGRFVIETFDMIDHLAYGEITDLASGVDFPNISSHRGSGRADDGTKAAETTAYRGTGRITPNPTNSPEFA